MDAEERLPPALREQRGDAFVREDHQLLDEHVRVRLLCSPRPGDPSLTVELELDLR